MGRTSIPCDSGIRDRVKEIKDAGDGWQSYDDVLEEMVEAYSNQRE